MASSPPKKKKKGAPTALSAERVRERAAAYKAQPLLSSPCLRCARYQSEFDLVRGGAAKFFVCSEAKGRTSKCGRCVDMNKPCLSFESAMDEHAARNASAAIATAVATKNKADIDAAIAQQAILTKLFTRNSAASSQGTTSAPAVSAFQSQRTLTFIDPRSERAKEQREVAATLAAVDTANSLRALVTHFTSATPAPLVGAAMVAALSAQADALAPSSAPDDTQGSSAAE